MFFFKWKINHVARGQWSKEYARIETHKYRCPIRKKIIPNHKVYLFISQWKNYIYSISKKCKMFQKSLKLKIFHIIYFDYIILFYPPSPRSFPLPYSSNIMLFFLLQGRKKTTPKIKSKTKQQIFKRKTKKTPTVTSSLFLLKIDSFLV